MAAQKKSFETLYGELEDTTRRLEQGNLPLEESIKLYEQGAGLVEELRTILDEAELHVKTLQVRLQPPEAVIELHEVPDEDDNLDLDIEPGRLRLRTDDAGFDDDIEAFEYEDDAVDD